MGVEEKGNPHHLFLRGREYLKPNKLKKRDICICATREVPILNFGGGVKGF